jgi:hypothetical protein
MLASNIVKNADTSCLQIFIFIFIPSRQMPQWYLDEAVTASF